MEGLALTRTIAWRNDRIGTLSYFLQDADDQFKSKSESFTSALKVGSVLDKDIKMENEECDVSGLINSDGEEENWKPVISSKWQKIWTRSDDHIFKLIISIIRHPS